MARRRGKSSSKQDESWLPLEPPAGQASRGFHDYVILGVFLLIITVGGSGLGWVCSDHQHMLESLSETLTSLQARITKLQQQQQQQLGTEDIKLANVDGFEERLGTLENAYARAQRQVELALATFEQIKSKDLQSTVWSLQSEMNDKLEELQQNTISIATLNSIIKNKSIEFEVVKQSLNTLLSANAEQAIQISGFSNLLSGTKLRLDEQVSIVDGLMSQLEGQERDVNEIKELFASNQESLVKNTQELMDIKELLESEQIKRTQNLEKQLRSLYKRLEDHQKNTESLHFHLAAQLEALQIHVQARLFLPEVQQSRKAEGGEVQVEDQITTTDNKERETHETELENIEEEFVEDSAKEDDGFNREQAAAEITDEEELSEEEEGRAIEEDGFNKKQAGVEVESSEWYVVEPVKETQPPSEDSVVNENVAEEQKEVDGTKERETLQVINKIQKTVRDEVETTWEDLDPMTMNTGKITGENVGRSVGNAINSHTEKVSIVVIETGMQMSDAEEIPTHLEDSSTGTTESEEAALEKTAEFTPVQAMQAESEETDTISDTDDVFSEEYIEHTEEVLHKFITEISATEITALEDSNEEKESETAMGKINFPSDKTDDVENQQQAVIPAEIEKEAVDEITAASPSNWFGQKKNQELKWNS